ncbi:hypothetical protein [Tuberibacillus sp. Marseille-P3662]|uniref:hypothetical protein n=1 Tax=Tuberibacillus sp. Marseille-P3662 TaxID=1965358 RepID=UPI000A1C851E|nr:hypothetical protein [Tuberibacillus sp. Marseille-P3662]
MSSVMWYFMGFACMYQGAVLSPTSQTLSDTLVFFIFSPIDFVRVAVFIVASFLIFSYRLRYDLKNILLLKRGKRLVSNESLRFLLFLGTSIGCLILFPVYMAITLGLTIMHLMLSMGQWRPVQREER